MDVTFHFSGSLATRTEKRFEQGVRLKDLRETASTLLGESETLEGLRFLVGGMWCERVDDEAIAGLCNDHKSSGVSPMKVLVFSRRAVNDESSTGRHPVTITPEKSTETALATTSDSVGCGTSRKRHHSTSVPRKLNADSGSGSKSCPSQMSFRLDDLIASDVKFDEGWYLAAVQRWDPSPILLALQQHKEKMDNSQPLEDFVQDPPDYNSNTHRPESHGEILDEQGRYASQSTSQHGRLTEVSFPQADLPLLEYSDEVQYVDDGAMSVFHRKGKVLCSYFWTYGPLIQAYKSHLRGVVIVDGYGLSHTGGILMTALAVDPDNRTFPLAFAASNRENEENWRFFFRLLKKHVLKSGGPLVIQTCRHKVITKLIAQYFGKALHVYCPFHLIEMISRTSPGAAKKFGEVYTELDEGTFLLRILELQGFSEESHENLVAIRHEKWTDLYISTAGFTRFSINSFHHARSWHTMILTFANEPLPMFVQCVWTTLARHFQLYRAIGVSTSHHLCRTAKWMLQQQNRGSDGCRARPMAGGKWMVQSDHPGSPHMVDMVQSHCTCNFWQVHSIPCAHAIACLGPSGQESSEHMVSKYYSIQTLRSIYAERWVPTISVNRVPIGFCCLHYGEGSGYPKYHAYIPACSEQSMEEN